MVNKKFKLLSDSEKDKFVNSGIGGRLTQLQSNWKTRNWPIMIAIRNKKVPSDTFGQLAYNFFK